MLHNITLLVICKLFLMCVYLLYRSEYVHAGAFRLFYSLHILIIAIFTVFWFFVKGFNAEIKIKILMIYTGVLLAVYATEIYCYYNPIDLSNHQKARYEAALVNGVAFDKRSKYEVYVNLKKKNSNIVPSFRPVEIIENNEFKSNQILPLSGISNMLTLGPNENGQYMIYQSDRYGFNNPDYMWDNKKTKWLILGDSFAQGVAVKQEENIAGNIWRLTKEPVINLGMSGNGPLLELASLKEYGALVKSENVLWIYYEGNDLSHDLNDEIKNKKLYKYLNKGYTQKLKNKQLEIDELLNNYVNNKIINLIKPQKNYYGILKLSNLRRLLMIDRSTENQKEIKSVDIFYKILKEAKNIVGSWGGNFYFVYLPEYNRYTQKKIDHDLHFKRKELIDFISLNLKIDVIDVHKDVFERTEDPLSLYPYRIFGHYNPHGYKKITEAVLRGITFPQ